MNATFKEQEAQHRLLLDWLHKVQAFPCMEKGGKTSLPGEERGQRDHVLQRGQGHKQCPALIAKHEPG